MDAVTLDINQLTTMPEGWKMDELYVKAPIATYADFKKEMLSEIGAAMGIPYAIVAGTSAGYTYASAKLDHQTYFRVLRNERGFVEDSILNRLFELWLREWSLANPDAEAEGTRSDATDEESAADLPPPRQGKNWRTELAQFEKEQRFLSKLGIDK